MLDIPLTDIRVLADCLNSSLNSSLRLLCCPSWCTNMHLFKYQLSLSITSVDFTDKWMQTISVICYAMHDILLS